jgi:hypothetical protein
MLQRVLFSDREGIHTQVNRSATWYGLQTGGLSVGQERRLRRVGRPSRRKTTREMLMRRADATLWFTDGSVPTLSRRSRKYPLLLLDTSRPLAADVVARWITAHQVTTLHVTGNRETRSFILAYLPQVFSNLGRGLFSDSKTSFPVGSTAVIDRARVWAVTPWPQLKCFLRITNRWRNRSGRLATALHAMHEQAADPVVAAFLGKTPAEAKEALFGFRDGHRRFIRLYRAFEHQVVDFIRGGAWMLVYILAHREVVRALAPLQDDDLAALLWGKQRSLWAMCGLPDSESVARTMRKIPVECCSIEIFHAMRAAFTSGLPASNLSHLARINLGAAQVAVHPLATTALVREVAAEPREDAAVRHRYCPTARLLHDIVEEARDRQADRLLRPVRSIEDAHAMIHEILRIGIPGARAGPGRWSVDRPIPTDPPAIPGLIEQLSDPQAVQSEGRTMGHCVANYAGRVTSRTSLIFHVLPGDLPDVTRATLELVAGEPGKLWRLRQVRAKHNGPVSSATTVLVEAWLQLANDNPQVSSTELETACRAAIGSPTRRVA